MKTIKQRAAELVEQLDACITTEDFNRVREAQNALIREVAEGPDLDQATSNYTCPCCSNLIDLQPVGDLQIGAAPPAPEAEPVAYVTGVYGGHTTVVPIDAAQVLRVGMALYTAPPEPPADVAHELTLSSLRKKLGLPEHCAERRILCAIDELIAKQVPADVARDAERFLAIFDEALKIGSGKIVDAMMEYEKAIPRVRRTLDGYRAAIDAARERQGGE